MKRKASFMAQLLLVGTPVGNKNKEIHTKSRSATLNKKNCKSKLTVGSSCATVNGLRIE